MLKGSFAMNKYIMTLVAVLAILPSHAQVAPPIAPPIQITLTPQEQQIILGALNDEIKQSGLNGIGQWLPLANKIFDSIAEAKGESDIAAARKKVEAADKAKEQPK